MNQRPRVFIVSGDSPDAAALHEAADIVKRGGLVVFPTETVYGLAADATNPKAIERLNQVKGRPPEKPYSLHLHDPQHVRTLVPTVPEMAEKLMARFWPGPLTIVLPGKDGKAIGFRLPDHPIARAFLDACGRPVVAPSANRSGSLPPTDAPEAVAALDGDVDCVLDGGPTRLGRESTVVEVLPDGHVEIRREGAISKDDILAVVNA